MIERSAIELDSVTKHFGGVTALSRVTFEIRRGEVHALVGENGAGKSTLMKLLAGVHQPDSGEIRLEGQRVRLTNPREARRHGVSIVFQELNLFPQRTIAENLFAGSELATRIGWVKRRTMREAARRTLAQLGVNLSPDARVDALTLGEKQLVEIARTLSHESRIIILDEPNSALNDQESQRLFEVIRQLRDRGITIIYVSHRLEEVFTISSRITVLRDGCYQGTYSSSLTSIPEIVSIMIGRTLAELGEPKLSSTLSGPPLLDVQGLCLGRNIGPLDFNARAGEIVGFAGLEGAGVDELFRTLFGLIPSSSGEIKVCNRRKEIRSPRAAMEAGVALVPASRREQGLLMEDSIARNATLLILDRLRNPLGLVDRPAIRAEAEKIIQQFDIAGGVPETPIVNLSGGNQQKVLLAKWLALNPSVLILHDPTRGVDIGAKREIHELCRRFAAGGKTILFTSSEVEEIVAFADRVIVLADGRVRREFGRGEISKDALLRAMQSMEV